LGAPMGKQSYPKHFPLHQWDQNWNGISLDNFETEINQLEARDTKRYRDWLHQWTPKAIQRKVFLDNLKAFYTELREIVKDRTYERKLAESIWYLAETP
jgi:GTP1/Obg family GTP-binding protein